MPQPLVSCVTPFYNTAEFLAECIESTLAQSMEDFELILLDNCSTDGSGDIALEYAAKDRRIRLFKNDRFLTQIENYNKALSKISSDSMYCKMIQADDTIYPVCLEKMVEAVEQAPSVGIVSSFRMVGTEVFPKKLPDLRSILPGREAGKAELIYDLSLFGTPTTVMVRSDLVREYGNFFPLQTFFPDNAAVFESLRKSDFAFVPQILSFTRLDDESIYGRWQSFFPMHLARMIQLHAYGSDFLDKAICEKLIDFEVREYYRMLGKEWLLRRESDFWDFHEKGLAEVGLSISKSKLLASAAQSVIGFTLSPKRVLRYLRG